MNVFKPHFIREDPRGKFFEILNGQVWKTISYGNMRKGAVMGNHYHKKTSVFFFLIKGEALVNIIDVKTSKTQSFTVKENEGMLLLPNHSHAIRFKRDSIFLMGKSEKYSPKNPDTYSFVVPKE